MADNQQDFAGSRLAWAACPLGAITFPLPPRIKWELLNRFGSELGRVDHGTSKIYAILQNATMGKAANIYILRSVAAPFARQ